MARRDRITLPQTTKLGELSSYDELEPLLIEAELKGFGWVFEQTLNPDRLNLCPKDQHIYELHQQMFDAVYDWAGKPRTIDVGPGGLCYVPSWQVRMELRNRFANLAEHFSGLIGLKEEVSARDVASIVAQAHHDFQFVHPFVDTNGRTGRVLDHYLLWVTFNLAGESLDTSPRIEHFPTAEHEDAYYNGIKDADAGYLDRLIDYYEERIEDAVRAI